MVGTGARKAWYFLDQSPIPAMLSADLSAGGLRDGGRVRDERATRFSFCLPFWKLGSQSRLMAC